MSAHFIHEFLWLLRARAWSLIVYALAWVALSVTGWLLPGSPWPMLLCWPLLLAALGFAGDAGSRKSATDSHAAWRTRPPRWLAVWLALLAYCAALAMPPFACLTVTGFLLEHTAEHWLLLARDAGFFLAGTVAVCALAGISDSVRGAVAATALTGLSFAGGGILAYVGMRIYYENHTGWERFLGYNEALVLPVPVALAVVAGFGWLWAMCLRQRAELREAIIAWVWVTLGPLLLWMTVLRWFSNDYAFPRSFAWEFPETQAGLRRQFPAKARFYTDSYRYSSPYRLHGEDGRVPAFAPLGPLRLPMEQGARGSDGGSHLHITRVRSGERNLEVTLRSIHTSTIPLPGAGVAGARPEGLLLFYFPAGPMVLMAGDSGRFRGTSLRHVGAESVLRLTMPDAEVLRGLRWTPDVMSKAQLYYFDLEKPVW